MLRGNGGQAIFFGDEDRYHQYLLLQEGVERFGHRIHGLCAMTNHLHVAVPVAEVSPSKIMQNVALRYARWINRRVIRMQEMDCRVIAASRSSAPHRRH
jgi:REP element-mobilizing transposase RayT